MKTKTFLGVVAAVGLSVTGVVAPGALQKAAVQEQAARHATVASVSSVAAAIPAPTSPTMAASTAPSVSAIPHVAVIPRGKLVPLSTGVQTAAPAPQNHFPYSTRADSLVLGSGKAPSPPSPTY